MQKNAISYFKYEEYAGVRKKKFSWTAKKYMITKIDRICRKMQYRHPPIQDTSFTHI